MQKIRISYPELPYFSNKLLKVKNQLYNCTSPDVDGVKVGVIGYITKDRGVYASYNIANITFTDEVEAVDAAAKELKEQGVDIIIAAGHAGEFTYY